MIQATQSCHYPNFDHCKSLPNQDNETENLVAPAREVIKYEPKVLDNSLFVKNIYKGNPSPELDEAWEGLVNGKHCHMPHSLRWHALLKSESPCRHEHTSLKRDSKQY